MRNNLTTAIESARARKTESPPARGEQWKDRPERKERESRCAAQGADDRQSEEPRGVGDV